MSAESEKFLSEEFEEVKKSIPPSSLESCTRRMFRCNVQKTPAKEATMILQFPFEYPEDCLIVELKSKVLPHDLMNKLSKACDAEVKKHKCKAQIMAVFNLVKKFIESNMFLPCFEDIRLLKEKVPDAKFNESKGTISMKLVEGNYFVSAVLTVPDKYPAQAVAVDIKDSNFGDKMVQVLTAHSREIARRCVERTSTLQAGGASASKKKEKAPDISVKTVHQVRYDNQFLKQAAAVEGRMKRRVLKKEGARMREAENGADEDDNFEAAPSLLPTFEYMHDSFAMKLPKDLCPACSLSVMNKEPKEHLKSLQKDKNIERATCGHWYHYECLDKLLSEPPFDKLCTYPGCTRKLQHHKWTGDDKKLEKRWAMQQAAHRELGDVVDFLGVPDEFVRPEDERNKLPGYGNS